MNDFIADGTFDNLAFCFMFGTEMKSVDELKSAISQLYSGLNVEQYQLEREHQLQMQLNELQRQIEPYEQVNVITLVCLSV